MPAGTKEREKNGKEKRQTEKNSWKRRKQEKSTDTANLLSGPRTAVLPLFKPVYLRCDGHKPNGSWDEGRRSQSGYTIERSVNPDFEEEFEFWMHR
ncbi:hypothetical protein ACO22_04776 [Paracoccidioides brasiliensis]|uniref:Uncharacterized protein n=1 Tax=Paracoccidioides brasiliensis TaxID=121759 RepID=A0A1D2JC75_PARBR|nr:hypothetical protein ACO22_04776 [Paracoccidioides brasiliensis]